jgi:hypothetical protein
MTLASNAVLVAALAAIGNLSPILSRHGGCHEPAAAQGVLTGNGQFPELVGGRDVMITRASVVIVPGRGRFPFDGTVPGLDRVEYYCRFELQNLEEVEVQFQVNFPLDADSMDATSGRFDPPDEAILLEQYGFVVRNEDKTYHVALELGNADGTTKSRLWWKIVLAPKEHREVQLSWQMPISTYLTSTELTKQEYPLSWMKRMTGAVCERVGYVTTTVRSWSGTIEDAQVRVLLDPFERYLRARQYPSEPLHNAPAKKGWGINLSRGLVYRQMSTAGWRKSDMGIKVHRRQWEPKRDIGITWLLAPIPLTELDVERFLDQATEGKPKAVDLAALRGVILAASGIAPIDENALAFAENQAWYVPREKRTLLALDEGVQAAIAMIEVMIEQSEH